MNVRKEYGGNDTWCFNPNHFSVWFNCMNQIICIKKIDEITFNSRIQSNLAEIPVGASINIVYAKDM